MKVAQLSYNFHSIVSKLTQSWLKRLGRVDTEENMMNKLIKCFATVFRCHVAASPFKDNIVRLKSYKKENDSNTSLLFTGISFVVSFLVNLT